MPKLEQFLANKFYSNELKEFSIYSENLSDFEKSFINFCQKESINTNIFNENNKNNIFTKELLLTLDHKNIIFSEQNVCIYINENFLEIFELKKIEEIESKFLYFFLNNNLIFVFF